MISAIKVEFVIVVLMISEGLDSFTLCKLSKNNFVSFPCRYIAKVDFFVLLNTV